MLTTNCNIEDFRKVSGIYYIINLLTNKKYIGSSINLYKRWKGHSKKTSNKNLEIDIIKFGKENFIFKIVDWYETISINELLKKEQNHLDLYYAQEYKQSNYNDTRFRELLYNYIPDAINYSAYTQWSTENKRRLSLRLTGEGNPNYGNKLNSEQKDRISKAVKKGFKNGRVNPNQGVVTTDIKKKNIIEGLKRSGRIKSIFCLNLQTKNVFKAESMKHASIITGIDLADIGRIVKNKQQYSKNYYFSYCPILFPNQTIKSIKEKIKKKNQALCKSYIIEDVITNSKTTVSSLNEVCKTIGVSSSSIYKQMKKGALLRNKYKIYTP